MNSVLVTGSCGLIGSEVAAYFARLGWRVTGVDNNLRATFFGPEGDTGWSGDHICYYSDLRKMNAHYPAWKIVQPLQSIFKEIVVSWSQRLAAGVPQCVS